MSDAIISQKETEDLNTVITDKVFQSHIVVMLDNDTAARNAMSALVNKNPDAKVVFYNYNGGVYFSEIGGDGIYHAIKQLDLDGNTKVEFVGHGDATSLGGIDAQGIVNIVKELQAQSHEGVHIGRINLVGYDTDAAEPEFGLVDALKEIYPTVEIKGYQGKISSYNNHKYLNPLKPPELDFNNIFNFEGDDQSKIAGKPNHTKVKNIQIKDVDPVDLERLIGKKIGVGGFGSVYEDAINPDYVIKKINEVDKNGHVLRQTIREGGLFLDYYGPKSAEVLTSGGDIYLRMRKVPGVTLNKVIKFPDGAVESFYNMILNLNEKDIYHDDLKAENIIFDKETGTFYPIDLAPIFEDFYAKGGIDANLNGPFERMFNRLVESIREKTDSPFQTDEAVKSFYDEYVQWKMLQNIINDTPATSVIDKLQDQVDKKEDILHQKDSTEAISLRNKKILSQTILLQSVASNLSGIVNDYRDEGATIRFAPQSFLLGEGAAQGLGDALTEAYLFTLAQDDNDHLKTTLLDDVFLLSHALVHDTTTQGGESEFLVQQSQHLLDSLSGISSSGSREILSLEQVVDTLTSATSDTSLSLHTGNHALAVARRTVNGETRYFLYDPNVGEFSLTPAQGNNIGSRLKAFIIDYLNEQVQGQSLGNFYQTVTRNGEYTFTVQAFTPEMTASPAMQTLKSLLETVILPIEQSTVSGFMRTDSEPKSTETIVSQQVKDEFFNTIDVDYKTVNIGDFIGSGAFGSIYTDKDDAAFIYKTVATHEQGDVEPEDFENLIKYAQREAKIFSLYYGDDSASVVIDGFNIYIRMYKVDGVPLSAASGLPVDAPEKFLNMITKMDSVGILHSDLHFNNVMYSKAMNEFFPIDMGQTYTRFLTSNQLARDLEDGEELFNRLITYVEELSDPAWNNDIYNEMIGRRFDSNESSDSDYEDNSDGDIVPVTSTDQNTFPKPGIDDDVMKRIAILEESSADKSSSVGQAYQDVTDSLAQLPDLKKYLITMSEEFLSETSELRTSLSSGKISQNSFESVIEEIYGELNDKVMSVFSENRDKFAETDLITQSYASAKIDHSKSFILTDLFAFASGATVTDNPARFLNTISSLAEMLAATARQELLSHKALQQSVAKAVSDMVSHYSNEDAVVRFAPQSILLGVDASQGICDSLSEAYLYTLAQGDDGLLKKTLLDDVFLYSASLDKEPAQSQQFLDTLTAIASSGDRSVGSLDDIVRTLTTATADTSLSLHTGNHALALARVTAEGEVRYTLYDPNVGELSLAPGQGDNAPARLKAFITDFLAQPVNGQTLADYYQTVTRNGEYTFTVQTFSPDATTPALRALKTLLEAAPALEPTRPAVTLPALTPELDTLRQSLPDRLGRLVQDRPEIASAANNIAARQAAARLSDKILGAVKADGSEASHAITNMAIMPADPAHPDSLSLDVTYRIGDDGEEKHVTVAIGRDEVDTSTAYVPQAADGGDQHYAEGMGTFLKSQNLYSLLTSTIGLISAVRQGNIKSEATNATFLAMSASDITGLGDKLADRFGSALGITGTELFGGGMNGLLGKGASSLAELAGIGADAAGTLGKMVADVPVLNAAALGFSLYSDVENLSATTGADHDRAIGVLTTDAVTGAVSLAAGVGSMVGAVSSEIAGGIAGIAAALGILIDVIIEPDNPLGLRDLFNPESEKIESYLKELSQSYTTDPHALTAVRPVTDTSGQVQNVLSFDVTAGDLPDVQTLLKDPLTAGLMKFIARMSQDDLKTYSGDSTQLVNQLIILASQDPLALDLSGLPHDPADNSPQQNIDDAFSSVKTGLATTAAAIGNNTAAAALLGISDAITGWKTALDAAYSALNGANVTGGNRLYYLLDTGLPLPLSTHNGYMEVRLDNDNQGASLSWCSSARYDGHVTMAVGPTDVQARHISTGPIADIVMGTGSTQDLSFYDPHFEMQFRLRAVTEGVPNEDGDTGLDLDDGLIQYVDLSGYDMSKMSTFDSNHYFQITGNDQDNRFHSVWNRADQGYEYQIAGGAGNDTLFVSQYGQYTFDGGSDDGSQGDVVVAAASASPDYAFYDLGQGSPLPDAGVTWRNNFSVSLSNVESIYGSSGNEAMRGSEGKNEIVTGGGHDIVWLSGGGDQYAVTGSVDFYGQADRPEGAGRDLVQLAGAAVTQLGAAGISTSSGTVTLDAAAAEQLYFLMDDQTGLYHQAGLGWVYDTTMQKADSLGASYVGSHHAAFGNDTNEPMITLYEDTLGNTLSVTESRGAKGQQLVFQATKDFTDMAMDAMYQQALALVEESEVSSVTFSSRDGVSFHFANGTDGAPYQTVYALPVAADFYRLDTGSLYQQAVGLVAEANLSNVSFHTRDGVSFHFANDTDGAGKTSRYLVMDDINVDLYGGDIFSSIGVIDDDGAPPFAGVDVLVADLTDLIQASKAPGGNAVMIGTELTNSIVLKYRSPQSLSSAIWPTTAWQTSQGRNDMWVMTLPDGSQIFTRDDPASMTAVALHLSDDEGNVLDVNLSGGALSQVVYTLGGADFGSLDTGSLYQQAVGRVAEAHVSNVAFNTRDGVSFHFTNHTDGAGKSSRYLIVDNINTALYSQSAMTTFGVAEAGGHPFAGVDVLVADLTGLVQASKAPGGSPLMIGTELANSTVLKYRSSQSLLSSAWSRLTWDASPTVEGLWIMALPDGNPILAGNPAAMKALEWYISDDEGNVLDVSQSGGTSSQAVFTLASHGMESLDVSYLYPRACAVMGKDSLSRFEVVTADGVRLHFTANGDGSPSVVIDDIDSQTFAALHQQQSFFAVAALTVAEKITTLSINIDPLLKQAGEHSADVNVNTIPGVGTTVLAFSEDTVIDAATINTLCPVPGNWSDNGRILNMRKSEVFSRILFPYASTTDWGALKLNVQDAAGARWLIEYEADSQGNPQIRQAVDQSGRSHFAILSGELTALYAGDSVQKSGVAVNLTQGTQLGAGAAGDVLTGVNTVMGTAYNDTLTGNVADNVLYGQVGDDVLSGGGGNDILVGGAGDDTYIVNAGDHVVISQEDNGAALDTVRFEGVSQDALEASLLEGDLVIRGIDRAVVLKDWLTGDNRYALNDLSATQTTAWVQTALSSSETESAVISDDKWFGQGFSVSPGVITLGDGAQEHTSAQNNLAMKFDSDADYVLSLTVEGKGDAMRGLSIQLDDNEMQGQLFADVVGNSGALTLTPGADNKVEIKVNIDGHSLHDVADGDGLYILMDNFSEGAVSVSNVSLQKLTGAMATFDFSGESAPNAASSDGWHTIEQQVLTSGV